jgi:hypothetical protein
MPSGSLVNGYWILGAILLVGRDHSNSLNHSHACDDDEQRSETLLAKSTIYINYYTNVPE